MSKRTVGIVGAVAVVVGLVVVAVAVARGSGQGDEIGRDGWVRTDHHPTALAVSGVDGGPLRVVTRDDGSPAVLARFRDEGFRGDEVILEDSAALDEPFVVAADGPAGTPWVVVGGGDEDGPLVAWSALDPLGDDARGATSRATGVPLPDSEGVAPAVVTTTEHHQVVAAVDRDGSRILAWSRYADGAWARSALDLPAGWAGAGAADLRLAPDGNRFVLGAVGGDPATLLLWASEEVPGGPVTRWEPLTDAPAGEDVCDLVALHWTRGTGVLLGWSPLTADGCVDEVRFAVVGHPDAEPIPALALEPGTEAIVRDALALRDGTAIAVGSREAPPHSRTGTDERTPALWIRPAGEEWERVADPHLTTQLDQEATVVSVDARSDTDSASSLDRLAVVTRPQGIGPPAGPGAAVWTWTPDAAESADAGVGD
ncbi:MAG TPA: hypothetical protein VIL48_18765 [Acidimicrobiales bacterium]